MSETLRQLVAIPSPSGEEGIMASYVAERCQAPHHTVTELDGSVAVHIPGKNTSKALLLNGHTDTVPPTEQWNYDPFTLTPHPEDADKMIGLGASDMLSGIDIMLSVAEEARDCQPPCDVWLLFSAKEETDSSGSVLLADWLVHETRGYYQTIGGVILEPTSATFVGVGHRGTTNWIVEASGLGGHSSHDYNQPTAIEKIGLLVSSLGLLRAAMEGYGDPVLGTPTVNPTLLSAGSAGNVVPTAAQATLNLRTTPQVEPHLDRLREELERVHGLSIAQAWPPASSLCDPDTHIYKTMRTVLPNAPFQAFPGATDQFAFHAHDIPMLIHGPGEPAVMHQPDEWVRLSAIAYCKQVIRRVISSF